MSELESLEHLNDYLNNAWAKSDITSEELNIWDKLYKKHTRTIYMRGYRNE